jgi:hypothetical protein
MLRDTKLMYLTGAVMFSALALLASSLTYIGMERAARSSSKNVSVSSPEQSGSHAFVPAPSPRRTQNASFVTLPPLR